MIDQFNSPCCSYAVVMSVICSGLSKLTASPHNEVVLGHGSLVAGEREEQRAGLRHLARQGNGCD